LELAVLRLDISSKAEKSSLSGLPDTVPTPAIALTGLFVVALTLIYLSALGILTLLFLFCLDTALLVDLCNFFA